MTDTIQISTNEVLIVKRVTCDPLYAKMKFLFDAEMICPPLSGLPEENYPGFVI